MSLSASTKPAAGVKQCLSKPGTTQRYRSDPALGYNATPNLSKRKETLQKAHARFPVLQLLCSSQAGYSSEQPLDTLPGAASQGAALSVCTGATEWDVPAPASRRDPIPIRQTVLSLPPHTPSLGDCIPHRPYQKELFQLPKDF